MQHEQFARSVAEAAVGFQRDLRTGIQTISHTVSLAAVLKGDGNPTWPNFFPPRFEEFAMDFQKATHAEFVGVTNLIREDQREAYLNCSASAYQEAVAEAHMIRYGNLDLLNTNATLYTPYFTQLSSEGKFTPEETRDFYVVRNMQSPPHRTYGGAINWNLLSHNPGDIPVNSTLDARNETVMGRFQNFFALPEDEHKGLHAATNEDNPHSFAFHPVYKVPGDINSEVVSILIAATAFDFSMMNLLPDNVKGMFTVVENKCGPAPGLESQESISYRIDGNEAYFVGKGDLHDPQCDDLMVSVDLSMFENNPNVGNLPASCLCSMRIYPTTDFENDYKSATPLIFAVVVAITFVLVALVFLGYDIMVLKRNEKLISDAAKSNAIVTSFVPDHLRDRLMQQQQEEKERRKNGSLKTFLNDGNDKLNNGNNGMTSAPLADLFLETTVIFGACH